MTEKKLIIPIKVLNKPNPWYLNDYKWAESGKIELFNNELDIIISYRHYPVDHILDLKYLIPKGIKSIRWISLTFVSNGRQKEILMMDSRYFGWIQFFGTGTQYLFGILQEYKNLS